MPTLLRLAIATIAFVGLIISTIVLAVTGSHDADGVSTIVSVLALCALWTAPTVAGTLVSSWSTSDPESARRMRRILGVFAAVTIAGAAGFIASVAVSGGPVWIAVLLSVVATAAFPASVALGGTARRAELRRNPPPVDADEGIARVEEDVRRGRRRGVIGGGIGLIAGIVLDVLLGLTFGGGRDDVLALIAFAVALAALGASVGRLTVVFQLAQRTRELLGSEYGAARRVGRVVRGKQEAGSPEELERAVRYARIASRTTPFQSRSSLLTMVAVVALQVPTVVDDGLDPIRIFVFALFAIVVVVILPLQAVQVGRFRRFAAAHPVP